MPQLADLKEAARVTWATGDYDAMMRQEGLYEVGARITGHAQVQPGEEVLDVACGTGNAAIPAARRGARVTGVDLTSEMLEVGRGRAASAGVDVEWVEGDAEDLPFPDRRFDVVLSTFGCMFAPRGEVVAEEISRVLRPGARVGLCAWTSEGVIGEFFQVVAAHLPPPPEGVDSPLLWGDEQHVRDLLEGTGIGLELWREVFPIAHDSVTDAVECYETQLGPVVEARRMLEPDNRWEEVRRSLADLFAQHTAPGGTRVVLPAEYLVVLGHKTE